ncbi:predicted protein [Histoplasma capsulatum var. duboisii H88]|uniref:Predicted protein n=1 Tax=Ajellomyces capsulatus (strain H88) TaxID=544711 RepID=F0UV47_AJEC8|nr:predicted protein [Histoplasma capsulatum var. duboisii H88]
MVLVLVLVLVLRASEFKKAAKSLSALDAVGDEEISTSFDPYSINLFLLHIFIFFALHTSESRPSSNKPKSSYWVRSAVKARAGGRWNDWHKPESVPVYPLGEMNT